VSRAPDFERLAFEAAQRALDNSVYILMPKANLVFAEVGSGLYEGLSEVRDDLAEVYRRLAYQLDRFWEANDGTVVRLIGAYKPAAAALVLEILALAAVLTGNIF
jgi:hypothetical protein